MNDENFLHNFGYIGDVSELLFDIFTCGLLSEQDGRKASLATRLGEWNKFLDGNVFKLPEHKGNFHMATIDAYLSREFAEYVSAWMTTGTAAPTAKFSITKGIIDKYFSKGHYDEELCFYLGQQRFATNGRVAFVHKAGLDALAKLGKGIRPPSICAVELLQLADIVAMKQAKQNYRVSKGVDLGL